MHVAKKGFSLVELSVVIVIIGLLVGVLVAARSIRNAAQVQAVISDLGKYKQAAVQYKEKYYYWPGDDLGAGSVWNEVTSNGNGDGHILGTGNAIAGNCVDFGLGSYIDGCIDIPGEASLAILELQLAGFTTGNYVSGSSSNIKILNSYFPKAPINIISGGNLPTPIYYFMYGGDNINKNTFNISDITAYRNGLGGQPPKGIPANTALMPDGAIKPSDALAIDIKIDDGAPTTSYIRGLDGNSTTCIDGSGLAYDINNDSSDGCVSSFALE